MNEKELWSYVLDKKAFLTKPFDRNLVWITKQDFEPIRNYFIKEYNVLNPGRSFRSRGLFSHIHAIEQGDYILAHHDNGNLAQFFPLGIIHLFLDVLPYFVLARVKGVSFYSIFTRPQ